VRSGETGLISAVAPGHYALRFLLGKQWLQHRTFCQTSGLSEFDDSLSFDEIATYDGINYSSYEITLHPTLGGKAKTHSIQAAAFALPPP